MPGSRVAAQIPTAPVAEKHQRDLKTGGPPRPRDDAGQIAGIGTAGPADRVRRLARQHRRDSEVHEHQVAKELLRHQPEAQRLGPEAPDEKRRHQQADHRGQDQLQGAERDAAEKTMGSCHLRQAVEPYTPRDAP